MNNHVTELFLQRHRMLYGEDYSPPGKKILTVRVNTIKTDAVKAKEWLENHGIPTEQVPWYRDALHLPGTDSRKLTDTELYKQGKIYIQSAPSMLPALVLSPRATERVLDMAAAPGSKTSQMAAMMENRGEILANDVSRGRLYKLNAVLGTLGVENVRVTSYAGQGLWKEFPETFDKVLLDAPCSMEGTLYYASPKKIRELGKLQRWLLRSAVSSARKGGEIVYSTCSMAPEENEEVIDWLLEKEKGKVVVSEIAVRIPGSLPGIGKWGNKVFDPSITRTQRIPPKGGTEPFFIARITKTEQNVPEGDTNALA